MKKPMYTRADVLEAENALKEALITLRNTIENAYPKGLVVEVCKGRARMQIEIVRYPGNYMVNSGVLEGFNLKTGSVRRFHWRDIQEVLGTRGPQGSIVPIKE